MKYDVPMVDFSNTTEDRNEVDAANRSKILNLEGRLDDSTPHRSGGAQGSSATAASSSSEVSGGWLWSKLTCGLTLTYIQENFFDVMRTRVRYLARVFLFIFLNCAGDFRRRRRQTFPRYVALQVDKNSERFSGKCFPFRMSLLAPSSSLRLPSPGGAAAPSQEGRIAQFFGRHFADSIQLLSAFRSNPDLWGRARGRMLACFESSMDESMSIFCR